MDIEDNNVLDLLKFNYQNLHQSVWSNHQTTWTVTGIFMSALTVMLGYIVKEFQTFSEFQVEIGYCITEALLIVWVLLTRIFEHYNNMRMWRLKEIEDCFNKLLEENRKDRFCLKDIKHNYSDQRKFLKYLQTTGYIRKLTAKITLSFPEENKIEIKAGKRRTITVLIKNDRLFIADDEIKIGRVKKEGNTLSIYGNCFNQYGLDYRARPKRLIISPMNIYYAFFIVYTILNDYILLNKLN